NNAGSKPIKTYISPRDPSNPPSIFKEPNGGTWLFSNYGANHAIFGISCGSNVISNMGLTQISDGTSNTVGFAEQYAVCGTGDTKSPDNYWHKLWAYYTPWDWERGPYFDTRLMSSGMAG